MSDTHKKQHLPLVKIGIRFGTYTNKNPGLAELKLFTANDRLIIIFFDLFV